MKTKLTFFAVTFLLVFSSLLLAAPPTGEFDRSFRPTTDYAVGVRVRALAVQPDGKFLIAGTFHKINDVQVNHVARFNADGTLDTTFDAGGTIIRNNIGGDVVAIALQPDGKIIVSGAFDMVGSQIRRRIARLNADGSFDPTFNANIGSVSGSITAIAVQSDGKILAQGATAFPAVGGGLKDFARLNADGSIDTTFNPIPVGVTSIVAQPDGKILISGGSLIIDGQTRNGIVRLNSNGTLDAAFNPNVVGTTVFTIALLPNGKMFIGGLFTSVGGQAQRRLAKLNSDGTLDTTFTNNVNRNVSVRQIAVQSDGKVVYSGTDTPIFRDNADGTPDADFPVRSHIFTATDTVAALPDNRVVVGGNMTVFTTTPTNSNNVRYQPLALLAADGTMNDQVNPNIV